jgi:exopolysaccharide biosynthesis polyprenyl glycosylphosphotransferase
MMEYMRIASRSEAFVLLLGDIVVFLIALWLALLVGEMQIPDALTMKLHLQPFAFLFVVWVLVFYIAGLYEKHTLLLQSRLPTTLLNAQVANSALGALFFYLVPYFAIAPKTNLFLDLVISFILLVFWRLTLAPLMGVRRRQNALLIASGEEMKELRDEVNNNPRYNLGFISSIDLDSIEGIDFQDEILGRIYGEEISTIVIDIKNEKVQPILPHLYNLIFSKVRFVDMYRVYEDLFDRVPLTLVGYNWFLENISSPAKKTYDFLKRSMDVLAGIVFGMLSLVFYPIIILGIKLDDGGSIFFTQERIGQNNHIFKIVKFRSMRELDGEIPVERDSEDRITRVGRFLRNTRLDELPQLWNLVKGDVSLIGPRPEVPKLAKQYEREIPYYNIRHLIKPGLSGWAQLYQREVPKFTTSVEATRIKLSYDLYYIKNRSFMLDVKIALKTIKTLLSTSGV